MNAIAFDQLFGYHTRFTTITFFTHYNTQLLVIMFSHIKAVTAAIVLSSVTSAMPASGEHIF